MSTPLTGPELLDFVAGLADDVNTTDAAFSAGYFYETQAGQRRVQTSAYYKALAQAKGIKFRDDKPAGVGRPLAYQGLVGTKGAAIVGPAYTAQIGLKPGDTFSINLIGDEIIIAPIHVTEACDVV